MVRMIHWSWQVLCDMGKHLFQATVIFLHFTYFVLTLIGGFVAQLTLIGQVAVWLGTMESFAGLHSLLIFIPSAWRGDCWRLLAIYGAFIWIGYILPAQQYRDRNARQRQSQPHPLRAAVYHTLLWGLLWGPVAMSFGLYERVAAPILIIVFGGLIGTYYFYVWQGKIKPQLQERENQRLKLRRQASLVRTGL